MAEVTKSTLENLKNLARLKCSEAEDQTLLEGLSKVLSHIEKLQSIDTEEVEPTDTVFQGETRESYREDTVDNTLDRKTFLDNAPDQVGGMIRTPPVMDNRES